MKLARQHDSAEIFYSIQGEGRSLGRPALFIRSAMCNLHCVWCDTDYTWNWENTPFVHVRDSDPDYQKYRPAEQVIEWSVDKVATRLHAHSCRNIVITGGEPLLQQREWRDVILKLRDLDPVYRIEIETNGTVLPDDRLDMLVDQYNVSPKLDNSGVDGRIREKPTVIRFFAEHSRAFFKYVVAVPDDIQAVCHMVDTYRIPRDRVYLMPEATRADRLSEKAPWVVSACKAHGFCFSDRLHIRLWGNKRGT